MAKSFREIGRRAEELIEQGTQAERNVQHCQNRVATAQNELTQARRQYEAARMPDENGLPRGDMEHARIQLEMAQDQLAVCQRALSEAHAEVERVRQQGIEHARSIEQHNQAERTNIEKAQVLRGMAFGEDAAGLIEGIASRLNQAEDSRVELLKSMGIDAVPDYVTVSADGRIDHNWGRGRNSSYKPYGYGQESRGGSARARGFGSTVSAPVGGGLRDISGNSANATGTKPDRSSVQITDNMEVSALNGKGKAFNDISQLSDKEYIRLKDWQENSAKYNNHIRNNDITPEVLELQGIIGSNNLINGIEAKTTVSLGDIGVSGNITKENVNMLKEKWFKYNGIMGAKLTELEDEVGTGRLSCTIIAPQGAQALNLLNVEQFNEVLFDSPLCVIEDAYMDGDNNPHIVVRINSSNEYHNIVNTLKKNNVEYRPIVKRSDNITSERMISRLCGGDMTKGSCSSLAFAYAGNKGGYDVLDFRDGDSREVFSDRDTIQTIAMLPDVRSSMVRSHDDFDGTSKLLEQVRPGKEYCLVTGHHAAVIRKTNDSFEYLELQHPSTMNGWHELNDFELTKRFGCSRMHSYDWTNYLIDIESLSNNHEFLDILGYINTAESNQMKGGTGYVR